MVKFIFINLFFIFLYFYKVSLNYKNPNKLYMLIGKKGAGKSTYLTYLSIKYNKLGYKVFSNTEIYNTYKLDINDIGFYDFPKKSVLLIDEVGTIWDNRDFKNFKPEVRDFFKFQRKKEIICYLTSQSYDVDKKLRDLCDEMAILVNYMGIFSVYKRINKHLTIHNANDENNGESFLTETYNFDLPFFWKIIYIPRYVKFFNSFECPPLPKASRVRYKYNNEPYLYKLTKYKYYIKDKFNMLLDDIDKKYNERKYSFKIPVKYINNKSGAMYYDL